jgi:hypothetical protein
MASMGPWPQQDEGNVAILQFWVMNASNAKNVSPVSPCFFSCQQMPRILQPQSRGWRLDTGMWISEFYPDKAVFFNIVTEI